MMKDYREQYEKVKGLSWEEFMSLDEVQVDASPSGKGNALYYNDKTVQTSVDFEGHDENTLWEDEKLAEELKARALKEMVEELSWETE